MAMPVVTGASLQCTMGTAPGQLIVTSQTKVMMAGALAATIQDMAPITNVAPCGLCTSMANPTVASATAAALGVLTPMPCVPSTVSPWMCMGTPMIGGIPALSQDGTLQCAYGGTIKVLSPGQVIVQY